MIRSMASWYQFSLFQLHFSDLQFQNREGSATDLYSAVIHSDLGQAIRATPPHYQLEGLKKGRPMKIQAVKFLIIVINNT